MPRSGRDPADGGTAAIYRETIPGVNNFWTRSISRWVGVGAVGLGIFGSTFVFHFWRDEEPGATLWLYGVGAALSLIALGVGLSRTRRMWSADSGA